MNDTGSTPNHYQALGLERGADERAVKKAYFALVRRYPPETHPEEFKTIRAAYETLSDPVARARYDAVDPDYREYGDDVAEAIDAAIKDIKQGDEKAAQARFEHLLGRRPDAWPARELLGLSYLRTGEFAKAKPHFESLAAARPEEFRHALRLGYALRGLGRPTEARRHMTRARDLAPDELEPRFALANVLSDEGRLDVALAEIEAALGRHLQPGPDRLALELRRIELLFRLKREPAAAELDALVTRVRKDPDKEYWRYVSAQLTGLAASLLIHEDPVGGNAVLSRCESLNPESLTEYSYPERAVVDVHELPEDCRRLLAEAAMGGNTPAIPRSRWAAPGLAVAGGLTAIAALLYGMLGSTGRWTTGELGWLGGLAFAAFLGLGLGVRSLLLVRRSGMPAYTTVHSLYLVDVRPRKVKLWPLVNLRDVKLVRHTYNGVYTHTQVQIRFGSKKYELTIRDEGYAQSWADYLLQTRGRLLELMDQGFMDAAADGFVVPRALLRARRRTYVRRSDVAWAGGAAAAALLFVAAFVPYQESLVTAQEWAVAASTDTLAAYRQYLEAQPRSRTAPEAARRITELLDMAASEYALSAAEDAPAGPALKAALSSVRTASHPRLAYAFEGAVAPGADASLKAAFAPPVVAARGLALQGALQAVLDRAGVGQALRLDPAAAEERSPRLHVAVRVEPLAEAFVHGTARASAIRVHWDVELSAPEGPRHRWSSAADPPARVALPVGKPLDAEAACYRLQADRAFDEIARDIAVQLGLDATAERHRVAASEQSLGRQRLSPYR